MSTATNKQTALEFFASIDKGDASATQALLTADFVGRVEGNEHAMNAQEFLAMGRAFATSFANSRHIIETQVAEGDYVETRLVWTGLHVADFNGVPASHKPVKIAAVSRDRFVGGKIAEHRALIDAMALMIQIGAIPAPR